MTYTLHTYELLVTSGFIKGSVPNSWQQLPPRGLGFSKNVKEIEIQNSLEFLQLSFDQLSTMFYKVIALRGSDIIQQNLYIQSISSVSDLNVLEMRKALYAAAVSFKELKSNTHYIETLLHFLIEDCRETIRYIDQDMNKLQIEKESMEVQVRNKEKSIAELEHIARENENSASHMEHMAWGHERQADESAKWGFGKLIVGGALTWFSGGTYLAYVGIATIVSGVYNVAESNSEAVQARELRSVARDKWNQARVYQTEVKTLRKQIEELTVNIGVNKNAKNSLAISLAHLEDLSSSLQSSTRSMTDILMLMDDMEAGLKGASLHTKSVEIIQNSYSNLSKKLERANQAQKDGLLRAWSTLQSIIQMKHNIVSA